MEDYFQKINSNLKIEHDLFIVRIFPHPMQYGHVYAPLTIPNICLGFYRSRPFKSLQSLPQCVSWLQQLAESASLIQWKHIEEETDRREGKGRRCCFGDGIQSIPCRTLDLAPG